MFSCQNLDSIENPSLKKLLSLRCNRLERVNSLKPLSIQINNNFNLTKFLYLIIFISLFYIFYRNIKNKKVK